MKIIFAIAILFAAISADAQTLLTPEKNVVEKKWLTNSSYQVRWLAVKDTSKVEIGKISTSINVKENKVIIVTDVSMKQAKSPWVDSTIADIKDLSPIYHSSYNAQRDMILNFGPIVRGFYNDKINKKYTLINDTTHAGYFDSNLYPTLICWLPLEEGYKQDISIYDYKPGGTTGVIKAFIKAVKKGGFNTEKSGLRDVWVVTVSDEIGGPGNSSSVYYIDVADRRLWKQQINVSGRTIEMELIEN